MRSSSLLAVIVALGAVLAVEASFINVVVKRRVDLKAAVVRMRTEVTAKAEEDGASVYSLLFPSTHADKISILAASSSGDSWQVTKAGTKDGLTQYDVALPSPASKGDEVTFKVTAYMTHALVPYPTEISQSEAQLVVFTGSVYVPSPYASKKQIISYKLPSKKPHFEDYTVVEPTNLSSDTLKYGPYTDVPAMSTGELRLHFENNAPFATFTNVDKEIEVSHWGNIAVEEQYDLEHTGAALKGGFARIDYQMSPSKRSSFRSLSAKLPDGSTDIYYRDIIGNISTSSVREGDENVDFEIETRFPLFGGWKTQWYQGYNIPAGTFLSVEGTEYTLSMEFGTPFESVVTDQLLTKVILPEGASVVDVSTSIPVVRHADSSRFTYLDTAWTGRPVISFTATNLVPQGKKTLTVVYTMPPMAYLREPMLLISAFFAVFMSYSVLSRIDLSISGGAPVDASAQ